MEAFDKFSSWHRLKKCIAWILCYKENLKNAKKLKEENLKRKSVDKIRFLTVEEMNQAEHEIIKTVQKHYFPDEYKCLESKSCGNVKKSSNLVKLDPILSKELICVGGRFDCAAALPETRKHPAILPKDSHVTKLIVTYFHKISGHSGREYVLAMIRKKYWILKGHAAVKLALSNCFECKKKHGVPLSQKMSDLPLDRLTPDKPPFTAVGIDFFGPFLVKRGRCHVKRYGCLFTCLTTRAVVVTFSLDTNSFINALRRFIARRGKPEKIMSDNGGNFVGAQKEMKLANKEWNQEVIHEFLLQNNVKWLFNPPYSSHRGGVWERCIRSVRRILSSLLKEQTLDDESCYTLLCEVESIMNGRPITKISDDPKDFSALTPNHLLLL